MSIVGSGRLSDLVDSSTWRERDQRRRRALALGATKICVHCGLPYVPKRTAKPWRNWCSEPRCEAKHERAKADVINERRRKRPAAAGAARR